jgi:hypothetical protein
MNVFVRENIGVSDLDEQRSWLVCCEIEGGM